MEDVTRGAKSESGKDEKKHKRGKSKISGTKSKMKKNKSSPAGNPHSKGGNSTEGVTSASDNNSAVRTVESLPAASQEDAVGHEEGTRAGVSEESPLKRGVHSKSRSRSESRSRFSGFFKRKKRSKSETDLSQGAKDESKKRCDSAEDVKRKQAHDAEFQASDSLDGVSFTPRTNMKRTSPHHHYDSRIQPRDRLKNMTVRDAVKEQRLRRVDSASRSPRRRRHDYNDDAGESRSGNRASSTDVKFALVATDESPSTQTVPVQKTSTLPKAARPGTWQPDLERSAFKKYSSNPEFNPSVVDGSSTNRIDHTTPGTSAEVASHDSFHRRGSIDDSVEDFKVYSSLNKAADLDKYKISSHTDLQNDGEDTKTLVNVSMSSQEDEQRDPEAKTSLAEPVGDSASRSKRKESLSKFLELRQHPPSLLSRYRSSSQSSDSGVTSRETSPANATAHRTARPASKSKTPNSHERLSPALPTGGRSEAEKSSNPYVISSVPIPTPSVITPRLSLNGTELDTEKVVPPPVRPANMKLDDSPGEASSVSSSPQVSSMASSFRSSDQGYDESGSSDSSDENSAFSTPPEETESKGDNTKHIFSPGVLEKALLTSGDSRNQARKFRELDLETWDKKQPTFCIDKQREYLTSLQSVDIGNENKIEKDSLTVGQRYIPRGVRRSKSDVTARYKSPRRLFRNTSGSDAQSSAAANQSFNGSLDAVTHSPSISSRFDEDRCSATSTSTLTNFDIYSHRGAQNGLERSEQKNLPVMGTTAQQKYRRTFSPSRAEKLTQAQTRPELLSQVIVIPSEEPTSLPSNTSPASTPLLNIPSPDNASRQTPSPNIPRRGILKPISKERSDILKNSPADSSPREMTSSPYTKEKRENSNSLSNPPAAYGARTDLPPSYPDIEIRLGKASEAKQPVVLTHEDPAHEIGKPERNSFNVTAAQETAPKIQPPSDSQAVAPKPVRQNSLPLFPVFHGLEIGAHKDPVVSNYSLADFLQEQSVAKWNKQVTGKEQKEVENTDSKKVKGWRKSFKRKSKKEVTDLKKDKKSPKSLPGVNEDSDRINDRKPQAPEFRLKNIDEGKFTVMVDKECQTSSWLINSIVSKKTPKLRKKALSVKKKKRRGSVVSDTFVPPDAHRHKDAHHRSSLGDLRKLPATDTDFTKDHARIISLSSQLGRSPSVKRMPKKTGILRPEPVLAGTSHRSDPSRSEEAQDLPKPKKLSLTAVILLKNRLARFREKKRKEKESNEPRQEEELVESEVPSDTFITIENELNLSKLEVSKETDIIDDIFEPEFSLDYNKKHLRFDPMVSEPMQSEEPLPPLLPSSSRRLRQRRESTMRERRRKCIHYCKKFIAFLFSHIGLCSLVVAYTIMGGVIFQALEDTADHSVRSGIRERREKVVEQLVNMAVDLKKTEFGIANLTSEFNDTVLEYQEFIHRQTKEKGWDGVEGANEESLWTFASSLLYAITVTTTIGYGHVAPKTPEGRIVTIGYAVIGIPLTLLCLTNIGDVMATGFRLLYGKVCCGVCCTLFKPRRRRIPVDLEKGLGQPLVTTEEEQPDKPKEVIHVPTSLCLLLIAAYIFAGAMLFSMWESWDILTGSYFCFITLSTIGFGDIVPGMDSNAWAHEEKLVLCALYLVLGLSLIAMCFNLVQEDVKAKCRWLGMKLGIVEKPEAPI